MTYASPAIDLRATKADRNPGVLMVCGAALALGSKITALNESELEINSTENFDADRPWQNYLQRLSAKR